MKLRINGAELPVKDMDLDRSLLSFLRDTLELMGTRYGCGVGQCGACTVHVDGEATRSCILTVRSVVDKEVTTIEGLGQDNTHPVQQALIKHQAPQCGYCMSGQVMAAAALFSKNNKPSAHEISETMRGNLCRCGSYPRIKKALLELVSGESQ